MGRLRKSVVDRIVKLRNQGYTQAETAEKTGVHLKTVQKHDPLRKSKKATTLSPARDEPIKDLETGLKALEDWVDSFALTLRLKLGVDLLCPQCAGVLDDEYGPFVCQKCGYEMKTPSDVLKSDQKPT